MHNEIHNYIQSLQYKNANIIRFVSLRDMHTTVLLLVPCMLDVQSTRHHVTSNFFVKIEKNLLPSSAEIGNTSQPDPMSASPWINPIPEFKSSTRLEFLSPLLQHTAHPRTGYRTRPTPSCVRTHAQQEPRCLRGRTRYLAERRGLGRHIYHA